MLSDNNFVFEPLPHLNARAAEALLLPAGSGPVRKIFMPLSRPAECGTTSADRIWRSAWPDREASLNGFLAGRCNVGSGLYTRPCDLWAAYLAWSDETKVCPVPRKLFRRLLSHRGFLYSHSRRLDGKQARTIEGVALCEIGDTGAARRLEVGIGEETVFGPFHYLHCTTDEAERDLIPQSVLRALDDVSAGSAPGLEWRQNAIHHLMEFFRSACTLRGGLSVRGTELARVYERWTKTSGFRYALGRRALAELLEDSGFRQSRSIRINGKQARVWVGIALRKGRHKDRCGRDGVTM
jgi:hypothetical protein